MKVGFIAPMSISVVHGGVRTQTEMTIKHLRSLGVEPVMISPWDRLDVNELDLIHVFGATAENSGILLHLSNSDVPVILSPILYSNRSISVINLSIKAEKLLSVLGNGIRSEFGLKAGLCEMADLILPNTFKEGRMIEQGFGIRSSKIKMVPNGVEKRFSTADKNLFIETYGLQNFVLFVGQASAERKNVIGLIKAAEEINAEVVIIGSFDNSAYSQKCLQLAGQAGNITLINTLDHDSKLLSSAYAAAKVFVLPSYFETPGIAALEAGLAGANIAITKHGGTQEYFGNHASYIDPKSTVSIVKAINKALSAKTNYRLKKHILQNYTWEMVAQKTFDLYLEVLK